MVMQSETGQSSFFPNLLRALLKSNSGGVLKNLEQVIQNGK